MTVDQLSDAITKSARFGNLNDRAYEVQLRSNLEYLGLAFKSEIFWNNVKNVLELMKK